MDGRRSAKTRRREHAAAVVCALTLFLALVAGSALRPHYTANSLPEPAAWAHTVKDVQPDYSYSHPLSADTSVEVSEIRQPGSFGRRLRGSHFATCG